MTSSTDLVLANRPGARTCTDVVVRGPEPRAHPAIVVFGLLLSAVVIAAVVAYFIVGVR